MTVSRIVHADPPEGSGNGYHTLAITNGRQIESPEGTVVAGAEYAIDGQPVSAETFRDVLAMLALPRPGA